jgi:AcrR family transcriptional regulator
MEKVDPRVLRTRKLLLDAFMSGMREKGFDEVSIQDIADRATLNRATFSAHFPDKYALLDTSMRELFGHILQHRLTMPGTTPHVHLRRLLLAVTDQSGRASGQTL